MCLYITEYCKIVSVENGVATGTFAVPVDLLDEIMDLSTHMLNAARVLKMKSRAVTIQSIPRSGVKNK